MEKERHEKSMNMKMGYGRFAAMVATSTVVMFILMYQATYLLAHVEFSQSRMWMAIVMGATMGVIMLGFMWSMYKSVKTRDRRGSERQHASTAGMRRTCAITDEVDAPSIN